MPGTDDPVRIGDFSQPVAKPPLAASSPTEATLKDAEKRLQSEATKDEIALQPMLTYEDRLKEVGLDRRKAAEIVDAVLLNGFYAEDIQITRTIKMRLRTRSARDTKRAQEILEAARPSYDHHYHESLTRILLAASLEQWGNDKLTHPGKKSAQEDIEKMFQERIAYVDNQMADPALRIAFQKLYKFDRMVTAALEEGAIENF